MILGTLPLASLDSAVGEVQILHPQGEAFVEPNACWHQGPAIRTPWQVLHLHPSSPQRRTGGGPAMTSISLALLGSMRGRKRSIAANLESASAGPKSGERLLTIAAIGGGLIGQSRTWPAMPSEPCLEADAMQYAQTASILARSQQYLPNRRYF